MTYDLNKLPFTHFVWFMENGDNQWRICAATMDLADAQAILRANDPKSGALMLLPADERPPAGTWY